MQAASQPGKHMISRVKVKGHLASGMMVIVSKASTSIVHSTYIVRT
jgi:hypothetical protein